MLSRNNNDNLVLQLLKAQVTMQIQINELFTRESILYEKAVANHHQYNESHHTKELGVSPTHPSEGGSQKVSALVRLSQMVHSKNNYLLLSIPIKGAGQNQSGTPISL